MLPTPCAELEVLRAQGSFEDEKVEVNLWRTRGEVKGGIGGVHAGCA